jgi:hypothetical protein
MLRLDAQEPTVGMPRLRRKIPSGRMLLSVLGLMPQRCRALQRLSAIRAVARERGS